MLLFISNSEKFQMLQLTMFQLWSTDILEVSGWQQRMMSFLQKRYTTETKVSIKLYPSSTKEICSKEFWNTSKSIWQWDS